MMSSLFALYKHKSLETVACCERGGGGGFSFITVNLRLNICGLPLLEG